MVVAPWEIDQLPDEWVELILNMGQPLQEMQNARAKVDQIFEKYRKEHPTYRKAK